MFCFAMEHRIICNWNCSLVVYEYLCAFLLLHKQVSHQFPDPKSLIHNNNSNYIFCFYYGLSYDFLLFGTPWKNSRTKAETITWSTSHFDSLELHLDCTLPSRTFSGFPWHISVDIWRSHSTFVVPPCQERMSSSQDQSSQKHSSFPLWNCQFAPYCFLSQVDHQRIKILQVFYHKPSWSIE